jgi:oxygen-independent coproporphyrinogen-3 oxidase
LPQDETLEQIQLQGEQYLKAQGFINYEVSAWRKERPSAHNLNYWQFGDYLAIGAGAHGKVTQSDGIYRFKKPVYLKIISPKYLLNMVSGNESKRMNYPLNL